MLPEIKIIAQKLHTIGKKLYIVGGFCREKILGQNNETDIDLVTDAIPGEFEKVLKIAGEVGKKYGTCIVREGGKSFELTTFREDIGTINYRQPAEVKFTTSLELDAKRRDFTCNSIYFDVENETFIDPNNGIDDINNKILRFVGDAKSRIDEDILRILRAIRFKNKYSFEFADKKYFQIFRENITLLKNLPIERIKQELDKMLLDKSNVKVIKDLKEIGFLDLYLKELLELESVPGNKHHLEGDVLTHTLMCLEEMNILLSNSHFNDNEKLYLLWGILLHDIGKKQTLSFSEKDMDNHYFAHEEVGANMFKYELASRFNFSNNSRDVMYYMIKNHIRIFQLPNMKTLKARKFMLEKNFPYLLLLAEADSLGKIPRNEDRINEIKKMYNDFLVIYKTKVFYTGDDVMKMFPKLEGRKIGEKLQRMNDGVLERDEIK